MIYWQYYFMSENGQGKEFVAFSEGSFSWQYIERPTIDSYLGEIYRQNPKVLDAGCGAGRVTGHLINSGIHPENILGIDMDRDMVESYAASYPSTNVVQGRVSILPFEAGSFDLIVSNMLLHQLDSSDLLKFLEESSRVLAEEGMLFFIDSNPYSSADRISSIGRWITQKTPWGTEIKAYIHDLQELLHSQAIGELGLRLVAQSEPRVAEAGRKANASEFSRYSRSNFRFAAKLIKA